MAYRFKISDADNIVNLDIQIRVSNHANLCTTCTLLTHRHSIELQGQTQTLSAALRHLIAADSMCLSSFTFTQRTPENAI